MDILYGFGLACIIVAGIAVVLLYRQLEGRIKALEAELARRAEEDKRQRHTESTISGLEDATAVLFRFLIEDEMASAVRREWVSKAANILGTLREGPRAYPIDPPSGERVTYKVKKNGK